MSVIKESTGRGILSLQRQMMEEKQADFYIITLTRQNIKIDPLGNYHLFIS